jgi:hypothetical protein
MRWKGAPKSSSDAVFPSAEEAQRGDHRGSRRDVLHFRSLRVEPHELRADVETGGCSVTSPLRKMATLVVPPPMSKLTTEVSSRFE